MIEALKQALEALEANYLLVNGTETHGGLEQCLDGYYSSCFDTEPINKKTEEAITSLRQAIAELESQEPVAHSVISGALFDFMGWLTSRKERIVLSSTDNASPAVEAITEFAKMRNLSLDDAKVRDWHTHPPQRTWVGLTDDEISEWTPEIHAVIQAIEAKLKEKNT